MAEVADARAVWRRARPLLGTLVEIGADPSCDASAIDTGFAAIEGVEALMSRYRAGSDIVRLNGAPAGTWIGVAAPTRRVLDLALRLHHLSDGLFECAIEGTLSDLLIGHDGSVWKQRPLAIDLGGIAKGEAVDRAVLALRLAGVRRGWVNAGGDLRVFGSGEHRIELRDPNRPAQRAGAAFIRAAALASSSACYSDHAGQSAIVDPRSRQPLRMRHGVTVLAARCVIADALTKVVALSADVHHPLLARFGARAWVIH